MIDFIQVENYGEDSTFLQDGAVIKGDNSTINQAALNFLDDTFVDQSAKSFNDTDSFIDQYSLTAPEQD